MRTSAWLHGGAADAGTEGLCGARRGKAFTVTTHADDRQHRPADLVALAERFNGLYKWELIHRQGPWRGLDDVEFATMTDVDWFNHRRLHGEITDDASYTTPPAFEALYYRQQHAAAEAVTQWPEQSRDRGASRPT